MFKAMQSNSYYLIFWEDEETVSIHKDTELQELPPEKQTTVEMCTVS